MVKKHNINSDENKNFVIDLKMRLSGLSEYSMGVRERLNVNHTMKQFTIKFYPKRSDHLISLTDIPSCQIIY